MGEDNEQAPASLAVRIVELVLFIVFGGLILSCIIWGLAQGG